MAIWCTLLVCIQGTLVCHAPSRARVDCCWCPSPILLCVNFSVWVGRCWSFPGNICSPQACCFSSRNPSLPPHCNHSGLLTSKNLWCGPCPHPECPSSPLLPPIITHGTTAAYVQATHITTCAAPILPPRPRLTAAGIPAIPLFYSPPLCLHSGWTA